MRALWLPALAAVGCGSLLRVMAEQKARASERRFPPSGSFIIAGNTRIHFLRKGHGTPVVLLHGNDGSLLDFSMSCLDELAESFDVIAIDRPGHGFSDPAPEGNAVSSQTRIVLDVIEKLNLDRPIVIGHSWGAMLALNIGVYHPEKVKGMVLVGAISYPYTRRFKLHEALESPLKEMLLPLFVLTGKPTVCKLLERAFRPDLAPQEYVEAFSAMTLRTKQIKAVVRDESAVQETLKSLAPLYSGMKVKVVILTGEEDKLADARHHSIALHKQLPNSELILLAGAGHQLQFTHPLEIRKAAELADQI